MLQGLDFFGNKKSVSDESGALPTHQNEEQTEEGPLGRSKEPKKKKRKKMIPG